MLLKRENACTLRYTTSIIPNWVLDFHRLYHHLQGPRNDLDRWVQDEEINVADLPKKENINQLLHVFKNFYSEHRYLGLC